jgi:hypothetical protein
LATAIITGTTKVSASGASERDHKDKKHIWTKGRNRMTQEKVEMSKHRYSALRLKKGFILADEVDPVKDFYLKYWEKEDFEHPFEKESRRLRGQPAQNDIRENTFFCFTEVWEHALYIIDEKTDSTARYRLLVKYKGMFIRDTDESYDDYRKVVDLEWSKGRVKDYGNKRGWVLVCELIPPYHDAEIALLDDDEDRTSISEPFTINTAFFDCILAASSHLQTRKIKTRAEAEAGTAGAGAADGESHDE